MPQLAPLIAGIQAAVASFASFIGGMGALARIAIGIGLQLVAGWLRRSAEAKNAGVIFEREYGETVPRRVAVGLIAVAGHDVYVNTWGPSNGWLHQVYQLSDFPCDALTRLAINGKWVTFDPTPDADKGYTPATGHDLHGLLWVKFHDGRQTTADADMVAHANPAGRWTAAHVGHGVAWAKVTLKYDKEKNGQFPDLFFEFRGARLYDWRKDSSVGGSGAHRWSDKTTWEFTENPRVIEYNYRRGLDWSGDLFCGMGMIAADLPLAQWTTAAAICDETADDGQKRYRVSMFLDCAATHGDNIEKLLIASAGMSVDGVDGVWPITGASQPVMATFTDDDLVAGEPVRVRLRESMARRTNSVGGAYPDPDNLWSPTSYETQVDAAALALDRRTRDVTINFETVRHRFQAESLAKIYLAENQFQAAATVTVPARLRTIIAGDWVRWNSARYGDRIWLVQASSLRRLGPDRPRVKTLTLMERDASIYDAPEGSTAPVVVDVAEPDYATETAGLAAAGVTALSPTGRVYPALRVSWSPIDDQTVTAVDIEYRIDGATDSLPIRTVPVDVSVTVLAEGVVSSTDYRVRTRIVTDPPRAVSWSAWATATTPATPLNDVTVELGNLADDSYDAIVDLRADFDRLRSDFEALATSSAAHAAHSFTRHQASVTTERGLAAATTTLSATVSGLDGDVTALAAALTTVEAQTDAGTANGLIGWVAQSAPSGVSARFAIEGRVTTGDGWEIGGAYFDLLAGGGSRWGFLSDEFFIMKPDGTPVAAFGVDGTDLLVQNVKLGTLTFNQLQSANGKLVIKGSGTNASIEVFS